MVICNKCGKRMIIRVAKRGPSIGSHFWGCTGYPVCRNTKELSLAPLNELLNPEPVHFGERTEPRMWCQECHGTVILTLAGIGEERTYRWSCDRFPECNFYVDTHITENPRLYEYSPYSGNWLDLLTNDAVNAVPAVKVLMPFILGHFVRLRMSPYCIQMFAEVIKPYLDNTAILDIFLHSDAIHAYGALLAPNGARIFYDLFKYLMYVESADIRTYLCQQFPLYYEDFRANPFIPIEYRNHLGQRML